MASPVSEVSTSLVSAGCSTLGPWPATHLQRQVPGHTIVFPFKGRHLDQTISEISYHLSRKKFGGGKGGAIFFATTFPWAVRVVCISGQGSFKTTRLCLNSRRLFKNIQNMPEICPFSHHNSHLTHFKKKKKRKPNKITKPIV